MTFQEPYLSVGFVIVHLFQICLFLFSPCVSAELYAMEVENMRLFLINKLLNDTGEELSK